MVDKKLNLHTKKKKRNKKDKKNKGKRYSKINQKQDINQIPLVPGNGAKNLIASQVHEYIA